MTRPSHKAFLAWVWTSGFSLAILEYLYLRWYVEIGPTASTSLLDAISSQFAPYLGAVIAFVYAAPSQTSQGAEAGKLPFFLALVLSGLWNVMVVGFISQACFNSDKLSGTVQDLNEIVPKLAWVVAPAIGFFFGKPQHA